MTYKTEGVILKYTDLGEASRLLTIYTRDFGKISVQARAVKKSTSKLAGHLEPLTLSQLEFAQGKFLDIVIDALAINNFKKLRLSLKNLAGAIYACELVDKLTGENVRDERIFNLLLATLKFLDKQDFAKVTKNSGKIAWLSPVEAKLEQTLVFWFGLKLLVLLGFAPEEELKMKGPEVLEKKFKYYLGFAPEQEIKSEGFLREIMH